MEIRRRENPKFLTTHTLFRPREDAKWRYLCNFRALDSSISTLSHTLFEQFEFSCIFNFLKNFPWFPKFGQKTFSNFTISEKNISLIFCWFWKIGKLSQDFGFCFKNFYLTLKWTSQVGRSTCGKSKSKITLTENESEISFWSNQMTNDFKFVLLLMLYETFSIQFQERCINNKILTTPQMVLKK